MHSVFNCTNNDSGIAAASSTELYRLGILIAVVVLIAALALVAGRRQPTKAYRSNLIPTWWRDGPPTPHHSSLRR